MSRNAEAFSQGQSVEGGVSINQEELNDESLLAVQIRDDELSELLRRLAATEATFSTPVPTIRDVAELTEAPPKLIARILGEIRGPGDLEKLTERLDIHEQRLESIEKRPVTVNTYYVHPNVVKVQAEADQAQQRIWNTYLKWLDGRYDYFDTSLHDRLRSVMVIAFILLALLICIWVLATLRLLPYQAQ